MKGSLCALRIKEMKPFHCTDPEIPEAKKQEPFAGLVSNSLKMASRETSERQLR